MTDMEALELRMENDKLRRQNTELHMKLWQKIFEVRELQRKLREGEADGKESL